MDNLLSEMVEAGIVEIQQVPTLKGALGRFLWAFTKRYQVEYKLFVNLIVVDNAPAGKGTLRFPLYLYNGVKVSNENGGLN